MDELVARVAAANPHTVVVLQSGGPVEMPWVAELPAILQTWHSAQETGNATTNVPFGDAEPNGRLPRSFPVRPGNNLAAGRGTATRCIPVVTARCATRKARSSATGTTIAPG